MMAPIPAGGVEPLVPSRVAWVRLGSNKSPCSELVIPLSHSGTARSRSLSPSISCSHRNMASTFGTPMKWFRQGLLRPPRTPGCSSQRAPCRRATARRSATTMSRSASPSMSSGHERNHPTHVANHVEFPRGSVSLVDRRRFQPGNLRPGTFAARHDVQVAILTHVECRRENPSPTSGHVRGECHRRPRRGFPVVTPAGSEMDTEMARVSLRRAAHIHTPVRVNVRH